LGYPSTACSVDALVKQLNLQSQFNTTSKGDQEMNVFALTFDDELRRVAGEESKSMEELVVEIAALLGCSTRQIYNYRSGKWAPKVTKLPVLCKRFGSVVLARAIIDECQDIPMHVPEEYELARLITRTVREDMEHYGGLLAAFESEGIDKTELDELKVSGERVKRNVNQLEAIAMADYERRRQIRAARSQLKSLVE